MMILRAIFLLGALALTGSIVWAIGADDRGLGPVLQEMLSEPWSVVTLIDLYLGFFFAAVVIFIIERSILVAAIWAIPVFFLGNVVTALWAVIRLPTIIERVRG